MSPEEKVISVTLKLKLAEWKLLVNELKQSEQLAARYGNRKMVEVLNNMRREVEFLTDYETDG